ncbi:MAG: response regulator transcription factor [Nitrospira sp.]|nr:response regulator transcription factor [Nitrospira sp.]
MLHHHPLLNTVKVLIADDHSRMRECIVRFVHSLGAEILPVTSGAEAIAAYRKFSPDWVLMDLEMEVLDGLEATRRIRDADPTARVLIVTQHDSQKFRNAAKAAGALGYYLKSELPAVLERISAPAPQSLHPLQ